MNTLGHVLLLMLWMKMKTLSPVLLLMPLMKMQILYHPAVAHALDDDGALFLLYENDHILPCTVAHAHDDHALPLLLLVMMICFLLFLMSLCHTHPDFFKTSS